MDARTATLAGWGSVFGAALGVLWARGVASAVAEALGGPGPRVFWYASRSAGWVAYTLLWLACCLGLLVSGRAERGPRAVVLVGLHRFAAGLSLAFVLVHAGVLLLDRHVRPTLAGLLAPFAFPVRGPWVGLGQLAAYVGLAVYVSGFLRRQMGYRSWRRLHYAVFGAYALATLHAVGTGTDIGPASGAAVVGSAAALAAVALQRARAQQETVSTGGRVVEGAGAAAEPAGASGGG